MRSEVFLKHWRYVTLLQNSRAKAHLAGTLNGRRRVEAALAKAYATPSRAAALAGVTIAEHEIPPADATDSWCAWDFYGARCRSQRYCSYQYHFGDLTFSQSCRLRLRPVCETQQQPPGA